jgi:FkbM family methyltransferase
MQTSTHPQIQIIEAHLLLGAKVKIDLTATKIGGAWQGKDPDTGMPRPWDPETLKFFYDQAKSIKSPVILDIGANTGLYCLLPVLNRSIKGYAFEPNPEAYRILKNNIALNALQNNIQTIPIALSDRTGTVKLKIPTTGTDSGLSCIGLPQRFGSWHEISVPMDTLDNVAKWKKISHVDLIKIDTEGCELPVLLGGEELIRSTFPRILLEFDERNTAQFGYHTDEIVKLLTSWGYEFRKISESDAFFYKKNNGQIPKKSDTKAESIDPVEMNYPGTTPDMTLKSSISKPIGSIPAPLPYSHWISLISIIENRLYYRDQSAESLESLTALARGVAPTIIVELGTLCGMSTRAWTLAVPNARIHAVDLSFKAFWKANEHFPVVTSRITFHEQNILSMDFKTLWSDRDRVLFFVDAHDLANVPIMRHVLKNALPHLPKDSLVVVDDIWFSQERLGPNNVEEYFDKFLLGQIDELQCFTGHYAPYHKGGSFMGFREVWPLMEFVNSRGIDLGFVPGGKHVWFPWDKEQHNNQQPARCDHNEREYGVIEYNPLALRANEPLASHILPKVARLYQQGQLQECVRILVDLINKEPSQSACFALAVCQARLGQLDDAYKLAQLARQGGKEGWRANRLADDLEQRVGRPKVRMTGRKGLTIFAVPKAFKGHEAVIQKNAIRSWACLDPKPEIILMGNDFGVREMALEVGARHIPDIATNEFGTPLVDDIFRKAWDAAENDILAYVNADIILMHDFQAAAQKVAEQFPEFLVIGRRWDLPVWEEIDFHSPEWMETLSKDIQENGFLHPETGLDYFIHPRGLWRGMPPFALGRTAWDNWLVKRPFEDEIPIIDGTDFITAVHQDHGYDHCRGGREGAWRGVEALRNRAMAGTIDDTCYVNAAKWLISREGELRCANPGKSSWQTDEAKNIRRDWLMTQSKRMKSKGRHDLAKVYLEVASAT